MIIVNKTFRSESRMMGQFSDGSDRQVEDIPIWTVEFSENGRRYRVVFDHEPTDEEILSTDKEDITTQQDLLQQQIDALNIAMANMMGV